MYFNILRIWLFMVIVPFSLSLMVACAPSQNDYDLSETEQRPSQPDTTVEQTSSDTTLESTMQMSVTLENDSNQVLPSPVSTPTVKLSNTEPAEVLPDKTLEPEISVASEQPPIREDMSVEPVADQLETGKVTVILSATSYDLGEVIKATVANGLEQTIYAEDLKSDCSIATLEQKTDTVWQPLLACGMERLSFAVPIESGRLQQVTVNPLSSHFQMISGGEGPGFGLGTYRIKFTYRFERGPEGVEPEVAFSEVFDIGP